MPKSSLEKISQKEAESFLSEYCSKYSLKADLDQELFGEILVRSSTKEFKGQYPASIHFSKDKGEKVKKHLKKITKEKKIKSTKTLKKDLEEY